MSSLDIDILLLNDGYIKVIINQDTNEIWEETYEKEDKIEKLIESYESKTKNTVLLIDKIDTIAKEDQLKFVEILKYRKIGTFDLPSNCVIILSANKVDKDTINEEIFLRCFLRELAGRFQRKTGSSMKRSGPSGTNCRQNTGWRT